MVWVRLVVPTLGLLGLTVFGLLYAFRTDWYFRIIPFFFANVHGFPFLDLQYIFAMTECWGRGIDVYVSMPCDPLNRLMAYSPLWLRATFLPTDKAWTNWFGVTLDGLFLLSLALLPPPRRLRDLGLVILATFSSLTVFALERGNVDLIMFMLAVVAGCSLEHSLPRRIIGYLAILLAGLLKFYPFVLLLLLLRERLARFVVLALGAVAVMAGFVWQYHGELVKAAAAIPPATYFADNFGALLLPGGLPMVAGALLDMFGWDGELARSLLQSPNVIAGVHVLLIVGAALLASRLAAAPHFRTEIAALPTGEMNFLVIGAALVCGCFFAGPNVGYRGIHLLFALPGVLILARSQSGGATRTLFRWTGYTLMFNMWYLTLLHFTDYMAKGTAAGSWKRFAGYVDWIIHELAWWWLVTVLLAVLFRFVLDSTVWQTLLRAFRRRRLGAAVL